MLADSMIRENESMLKMLADSMIRENESMLLYVRTGMR
jgi:hypothetical protein